VNWRHAITAGISELSGIVRSHAPSRKCFRIILYHAIGSRPYDDNRGVFSLSPDQFSSQMEELAASNNFHARGLFDLLNPDVREGVVVTFDDGYRDNLTIAAPILEKYRIPFTVFVSTSFVKDRGHLYLSPEELRELSNSTLVTIGSHGVTHVPLTQCNDHDLHNELSSSKQYLEDLIGKKVIAISYPHGAVDKRVRDAAENIGYELGASSYFGFNDVSIDLFMLRRICILSTDSKRVFAQKINGDWDWYYRWQRIQDGGRWG
jgi:peptidoglycan/xylan/chitin deacetylase (PgdA/CDA1 family)